MNNLKPRPLCEAEKMSDEVMAKIEKLLIVDQSLLGQQPSSTLVRVTLQQKLLRKKLYGENK